LITPIDFLADLFNPSLAFLPRALAAVLLASVVTGVVGCHVLMRGMVFIGDAVAHSVFPGLAVAFVLGGNLMVGGLTAGVVTAILVAIFSQNQRLREDSVIGIFFAASFALGIVIISLAPGYSGSVQDFLFGSIVGVSNEDITNAAIMGAVILLVLWLFHRQIVTVSLDRESARAMGLPVLALDIVLYVLVTISVVLGLQTLGNVLVLALLVIPASAGAVDGGGFCAGVGGDGGSFASACPAEELNPVEELGTAQPNFSRLNARGASLFSGVRLVRYLQVLNTQTESCLCLKN